MGAFDNDLGTPFTNEFNEDEPFTCEGMTVGPIINTSFGEARVVFLQINGERYSIFGNGLLNQARNATPDDFPARVMLVRKETKGGQAFKTLVPVDENYTGKSDVTPDAKPDGKARGKAGAKTDDDIPF